MARCFLDLDGVMADFVHSAICAHGHDPALVLRLWPDGEYSMEKVLGVSTEEFWTRIERVPCFWSGLYKTPDADDILAAVEKKFGKENVCILTSPSRDPMAAAGKMMWIQKHMPDYARRFFIGSAKHFCARPDSWLIDDSDHNCKAFQRDGGHSIVVPRRWNSCFCVESSAADLISAIVIPPF